jgi:hypothetical protein
LFFHPSLLRNISINGELADVFALDLQGSLKEFHIQNFAILATSLHDVGIVSAGGEVL